jgi:hypothetical protein
MADVVLIVEDLDSLIVSALCGAMIRPQGDDEVLSEARSILERSAAEGKVGSRLLAFLSHYVR